MTKESILIEYREGKLTIAEAQEKLRELSNQSSRRPLSEGQKGLWMLQKMSPGMSAYNVPICFRTGGKLDVEKFKQACFFVREQHPVLGSAIVEIDGVPYQAVQPSSPLDFRQEDISHLKAGEI
ncbi:MAG: condensation domain-containing protein, partial [Clostridia bacterium]|nr:condensation domain-containing protein [Clostridia bacterium]